jgi:hypothetical protein
MILIQWSNILSYYDMTFLDHILKYCTIYIMNHILLWILLHVKYIYITYIVFNYILWYCTILYCYITLYYTSYCIHYCRTQTILLPQYEAVVLLLPIAEDRECWNLLTPKVKFATKLRDCCCGLVVLWELQITSEQKTYYFNFYIILY